MNGSGKTVLFKCICGFLHPTSGSIWVNGEKIGKDTDFPKDTGFIIETPGFFNRIYRISKPENAGRCSRENRYERNS